MIPCALLGALVGAWTVDPGLWDAHGPLAGVVAILLVLLVLAMRLREQIPVIERGTRAWRINATDVGFLRTHGSTSCSH